MRKVQIEILDLAEVDSTNRYAVGNFEALEDGTLVVSDSQSAGKGRLGRCWQSPPGVNIYATLVMKRIVQPFYATMACSLSVLELLQDQLPRESFFIKWPNDIYVDGCKIAGILCEGVASSGVLQGVAAGMGININMERTLLDRIGQRAASLKSLSQKDFNVKELVRQLGKLLEKYYTLYLKEPEKLFAEWKEHNWIIGRRITLSDLSGAGKVLLVRDIAVTGEILGEDSDGNVCRYHCGDVTLHKESFQQGF